MAIMQNPNASMKELTWRGTVSRYWSERSLAMLLMASGTLIKDREYGLAVGTQLPIRTLDELAESRGVSGNSLFILLGLLGGFGQSSLNGLGLFQIVALEPHFTCPQLVLRVVSSLDLNGKPWNESRH